MGTRIRKSGPWWFALSVLVINLMCQALQAQNRPSTADKQMQKSHCGGPAIAYLARKSGILWVEKKHRAEVASLYRVEKASEAKWMVQIPGGPKASVRVFEVDGEIPERVRAYAEGDISTIPNLKCSGNVAAVTNQCTNSADGKTSASYTGSAYKECMVEDQATCSSTVTKVGGWTYYAGPNCTGATTGSTEHKTETCK